MSEEKRTINDAHAAAYGLPKWRECDLQWLAATLLSHNETPRNVMNTTNGPEGPQQDTNERETNDE